MTAPQRFAGNRLRSLREARGWTREQLAVATGRGYESISSYELGRAVPSVEALARMVSALDVDMGELFEPDTRVAA